MRNWLVDGPGKLAFWIGMTVVVGYWYSVHPVDFSRPAYAGDTCFSDFLRQLMSEIISENGRPAFSTDRVMAPTGASIPYMSWMIERDWLGAYFWRLNPAFPFLWAYFGFSLLISYFGVGAILRHMQLGKAAAWGLAAFLVTFHVPRHFKIWHHYEHLLQHWVYLGIFLDAWIWQRLVREKRWSWNLELWRGVLLVGMLGTTGYFVGPMILEWGLVRICLLAVCAMWARRGIQIRVEGKVRAALLPIAIGFLFILIAAYWYLALLPEANRLGAVKQGIGWFAGLGYLLRPLWLQPWLEGRTSPLDRPETVITIGWIYWVPLVLGLHAIRKKKGGAGWITVMPLALLLLIAILYACLGRETFFHRLIQGGVPFMSFFRVASRWGLFFPPIVGALIVLVWPEFRAWVAHRRRSLSRSSQWMLGMAFLILAGIEISSLSTPVNMMPPLPEAVAGMLDRVGETAGSTVLDMPFCVAGGNGVCSSEMCNFYPSSVISNCLRNWHGKKVYGLYQARMLESHCELYRRAPYQSWFAAWRGNRCLEGGEWEEFCQYLGDHSELSAILYYPDIWSGSKTAKCQAQFQKYLGSPISEGEVLLESSRGGQGSGLSRIVWYQPRCKGR